MPETSLNTILICYFLASFLWWWAVGVKEWIYLSLCGLCERAELLRGLEESVSVSSDDDERVVVWGLNEFLMLLMHISLTLAGRVIMKTNVFLIIQR